MRRFSPMLVAAAIGVVAIGCDQSNGPSSPSDAPVVPALKEAANGDVIPGAYIVTLADGVDPSEVDDVVATLGRAHGASVDHVYKKAIRGFAARMTAANAAALASDSRVRGVEPDRVVRLDPEARPGGSGGGGSTSGQVTPWGITRVGGAGDGTGKVAYIIDTGIDTDHPDLNVNTSLSRNFVGGKNTIEDGNGHGTHVSGTIGAKNNGTGVVGVAAGATVVSIRVLDNSGSGSYSGIIAGVNYVASVASAGDVANMSLGGPHSDALDNAVRALAATGVRVVIAAGNDGSDVGTDSPADVNATNVYTVSAIGSNDCLTSWSNYGLGVDWAAPGQSILSTWKGGGTKTISGTSMAAPHVAGLLLLGSLRSDGNACSDRDGVADPIAHR